VDLTADLRTSVYRSRWPGASMKLLLVDESCGEGSMDSDSEWRRLRGDLRRPDHLVNPSSLTLPNGFISQAYGSSTFPSSVVVSRNKVKINRSMPGDSILLVGSDIHLYSYREAGQYHQAMGYIDTARLSRRSSTYRRCVGGGKRQLRLVSGSHDVPSRLFC